MNISNEEKVEIMRRAMRASMNADFESGRGESKDTVVLREAMDNFASLNSISQETGFVPASIGGALDELRDTKKKGKFSKL